MSFYTTRINRLAVGTVAQWSPSSPLSLYAMGDRVMNDFGLTGDDAATYCRAVIRLATLRACYRDRAVTAMQERYPRLYALVSASVRPEILAYYTR